MRASFRKRCGHWRRLPRAPSSCTASPIRPRRWHRRCGGRAIGTSWSRPKGMGSGCESARGRHRREPMQTLHFEGHDMEARCRCCGQDGLVQNRVRGFGRTGVAIGYIVAGVLAFAAVRDFATSWNELLGASEILLSARVKRVGLPAATVLPLSKWEAIEASDWASLTDTQRLAVDDLRRSLHAESLDSAR